jgi:hypothetical protein
MSGALLPVLLICCPADDRVEVTVVVVLATRADDTVDPKLAALAREVRKRDETLTGFKLVAAEVKSIPVGSSHTFELVDKQELKVTVTRAKDAEGRITMTIKAPKLEKVNYGCACDKFFPVVTPHETKSGDVLVLAVMAKPCAAHVKKGGSWFPWRDE